MVIKLNINYNLIGVFKSNLVYGEIIGIKNKNFLYYVCIVRYG